MEEKSTSEASFRQLWQSLNHNQRRFAVAMLDSPSKKEAALAINLEPNTVYKWNGPVDEVVEILLEQARDSAYSILEGSVVKAAMVKVSGLDSDDERVRQSEATEILDRVMGKPKQEQAVDLTTKGESLNASGYTDEQRARAVVALFDALRARIGHGDSGESGAMDAAERPAMAGAAESSG